MRLVYAFIGCVSIVYRLDINEIQEQSTKNSPKLFTEEIKTKTNLFFT